MQAGLPDDEEEKTELCMQNLFRTQTLFGKYRKSADLKYREDLHLTEKNPTLSQFHQMIFLKADDLVRVREKIIK